MKFKKAAAVLLSLAMMASTLSVTAFAGNDYQLTPSGSYYKDLCVQMDKTAFTSGSFGSAESTGNIGGKLKPGSTTDPAYTPEFEPYYEYTDATVQWTLRDGVLVFSGTGGLPNCYSERGPFKGNPYINTVIVDSGVKYLNGTILQDLPNLTTVIVIDGHTQVSHAVDNCPNFNTLILGADMQNKVLLYNGITSYGEPKPQVYMFSTMVNHNPEAGTHVLNNITIPSGGDYAPYIIKDGKVPTFHNYDPTANKRCTIFATEYLQSLDLMTLADMKSTIKPIITGLPQFAQDMLPTALTGSEAPVLPGTHFAVSAWAKKDVARARSEGLIPVSIPTDMTQNITREQFCEIAVALYEKLAWHEIEDRKTFADTVNPSVEKLAAIGVINGVGNNMFAPTDVLTRAQAAAILSRLGSLIGLDMSGTTSPFQDIEGHWAAADIAHVYNAKLMNGVKPNTFSPYSNYTIQQAVVTLLRMMDAFNGH